MAEPVLEFRLPPRSRQILTAVIESYIESGEPVGSHTIAARQGNRDGLSAATIRNVMAELAEQGLLEQPHTSAGRIPTARAFRYYAQQSMGGTAVLTGESRARLDDDLAGIQSPNEFLERTTRILAALSSGVGVAMRTPAEDDAMEHVHFQKLASGQVLAIMVMRSGTVRDRVLALDRDLTPLDLETSARYLNDNFRGFTLERARAELARRLESERSEYDRLMQSLRQISQAGVFRSVPVSPEVFIEGVSNLVVSETDRERLRQLLAALEEKQRLVTLLNAYVNSQSETVQIVVGLEDAHPEMRNLVLIATPARVAGESVGALAVIGSTRMRYDHTIGAVQYAAQLFERLLQPPGDVHPTV
jgi:heat-inducible transcriptional repressor